MKKAERFFLKRAYKGVQKPFCKLFLLTLVGFYACLLLCLLISQTKLPALEKKLLYEFSSSFAQSTDDTKNGKVGENTKVSLGTWSGKKHLSKNLWDDATTLPQWMKDYFAWHKDQRARLNERNWKNFKYLVMQCTQRDRRCGGAADRLKSIPLMVLLGHLTKRILMIHWDAPKPLEEFLLPPVGGLDWRMPDFLIPEIGFAWPPINSDTGVRHAMEQKGDAICWNLRYQTYHSGSQFFNKHKPEGSPSFDEVYHELWRIVFTPSPPVAHKIEDFMQTRGLVPGQYAAAHVRAQYSVYMERPKLQTRVLTQNALNCASRLYPGGPIFLASDDPFATEVALNYGILKGGVIVARNETNAPLHLERAKNGTLRNASEYYDTFVDLYLMGMSRCVTYNKGGFGHWAFLMSYNISCKIRHQFNLNFTACNWASPPPQQQQQQPLLQQSLQTANPRKQPIFIQPMVD